MGKKTTDTQYKPSDTSIRAIPIKEIVSNSENPRESAPTLSNLGYGIFHKIPESDKPPLVPLALSDEATDKAEYVKLMNKEPGIADLAADLLINGQIHPGTVRPHGDGKGYDLVVGCRRLLAVLYNHCKTAGTLPANFQALVKKLEDKESLYYAFSENAHRLNMSPIEEAQWFRSLEKGGLKAKEIAEKTNYDYQIVRNRLKLLNLSQEDQKRVHEGELGVVKATEILTGKRKPDEPSTGRGGTGKGDGSRKRAPTLKELQEMYENHVGLHEEVRKWMSKILQVDYMPYDKLQAEKKRVEEAMEKKKK